METQSCGILVIRLTNLAMCCVKQMCPFFKTLNYVVKCCIVSYTCIVFNECKNRRVPVSCIVTFIQNQNEFGCIVAAVISLSFVIS